MKYILLCALLISGAFFSISGHAQEQQPPAFTCPDGGTYQNHPDLGPICSEPAPSGELYRFRYGEWLSTKQKACDSSARGYMSYLATTNSNNVSQPTYDSSYGVLEGEYACRTYVQGTILVGTNPPRRESSTDIQVDFSYDLQPSAPYCPPDNSPALTSFGGEEPNLFCWAPATPEELEPCDCSELSGEGTLPYTSFIAQKGVYSASNPPQCNTVTDPDTGQQCHCQLVAQKWLQTTHTNNGVEYDRWSPLPYDKDKPSGTYTGVACGDEDADTAPPEKEECFTLKSGVKWCFANPDEKCTVVNGQEQCSTGCGYVNGDFVCYEDKDPIIPDRPNEDMEEIDDTITDPDKTMPDINKGDLKQIQRGTEQRLDNVIIGVNNNNNQLQNIGDKIGQTNSKLDGIGEQLDGQGKSLKGIADGIEDAFGDEGSPDGKCEGECTGSWYESAYPDGIVGIWEEHKQAFDQTPAFQFLNQFKVTPSGSQPDWSLCFNLGPMGDFGCDSIAVPDFVWNFIKICILITAAFLCRALIFGG